MTVSALGCAPVSSPIPLAQFSEAYADAVCAKLFGCCEGPALAAIRAQVGGDEAACRTTLGTSAEPRVASGARRYDASEGGACVNQLNAYTCAEFSEAFANGTLDLACTSTFRGQRAVGEPCELPGDCVATAYCDISGPPLQCRPRRADGEGCDWSMVDICLEGAACRSAICVRLQPLGATCAGRDECMSSQCVDGRCAPGLPVCVAP